MQKIILPGGDKQFEFLTRTINLEGKSVLLVGSNLAPAAYDLSVRETVKVEFIVPDYESLLNANMYFAEKKVIPKMMEFEVTDYEDNSFDVIYAQASVSGFNRKKIVKEFKRILKPSGILCVGEVIIKQDDYPAFAAEILENSDIDAMKPEELKSFYSERGFELLKEADFSDTLKEFYSIVRTQSKQTSEDLTEREKSYYKKLLKKASHEANAFLNFGADKYIGFYAMILRLGK